MRKHIKNPIKPNKATAIPNPTKPNTRPGKPKSLQK